MGTSGPPQVRNRFKSSEIPGTGATAPPRPGLLPGGSHGDGLGLRSAGSAVGDGLSGADAGIGSRGLVATVDGLDHGGVAGLGRAGAAAGLHHRWGLPPDSVLPARTPTDERSAPS